jgi:hypothetical protein
VEFIRSFREILDDKNSLLDETNIGKMGLDVKKKRPPDGGWKAEHPGENHG